MEELRERMDILDFLLSAYNDGRRKTLYCAAANLLPLPELLGIRKELEQLSEQTGKERALQAVQLLQGVAEKRGISLKFNRKPKNKT